jgi:hypothetical protein
VLSLRELQQRFAAGLLESSAEAVTGWIRADGIDPSARLAIYRNNVHAAFIKTLGLEFPVIRRLVGEDYFRQLSLAFLGRHPSRSGDLHHVGMAFASFLGERLAETEYRYLADVARLEWACQECLVAEDSEPLDPQTLRAIPADTYGGLRFTLRPACRLVHSAFPVMRIWEANQPDAAVDQTVDLRSGPDYLVVMRSSRVELCRVPGGDFHLLTAFSRGRSLDGALDAALASDPQFDLGVALQRCIGLGVLARLTPQGIY